MSSLSKLRVPLGSRLYAMVTWLSLASPALRSCLHLPTSLCRNVRGLWDPQPAALSGCSHPRPPLMPLAVHPAHPAHLWL